MNLIAKASIQIQRPVEEVYTGIVNPEKMTNYFISESSGMMETGKELIWKFPEFEDRFPITAIKTVTNKQISFVWDPQTEVHIELEAQSDGSTVVKVSEDGKPYDQDNLKWLVGNTEGWANFLACMKAYLEYGIQLRKGAFDFMFPK